jgi:coproporphyrinogen III oxidase-like Fe-S oxidoreductase
MQYWQYRPYLGFGAGSHSSFNLSAGQMCYHSCLPQEMEKSKKCRRVTARVLRTQPLAPIDEIQNHDYGAAVCDDGINEDEFLERFEESD